LISSFLWQIWIVPFYFLQRKVVSIWKEKKRGRKNRGREAGNGGGREREIEGRELVKGRS
jgi:hypothetical protein